LHQCHCDLALDHLLFQSEIELLDNAREFHLSRDAVDGLLLERTGELSCYVQGNSKKAAGIWTFRTLLGVVEDGLLDKLVGGLGGAEVTGGELHKHVGHDGGRCNGVVGADPRERVLLTNNNVRGHIHDVE
jgi:hypothetical protein